MFYHRHITSLRYEPSIFNEIVEYGLSRIGAWNSGYDANGFKWNVEELPLSVNEFPILAEIAQGLQNEFKRPSFFLSRVLPGGLVNHIDHRKWGNLAFPLTGTFEETPQFFLDHFNHVIEKFTFQRHSAGHLIPVMFNTRMSHSVLVKESQIHPRIVLMMDLFDWPDHLFAKVDQNIIWNSTEHFIYDSN